jgi:aspartyl-tRNA(Asn)/glutamyl-tRNA(Gln) amidotransferase subunit C
MIAAMPELSRGDVEHVAYLARLGQTDGEIALLQGQLNHILEQYEKLAELDTEAIPPTAQTIELENILREDVVTPSLPVEAVLGNAAFTAGGYVVVPAVLGEESERPAR